MQQQARTKGTPIRLDIRHLEMRNPDNYPFGQQLPHAQSVVHFGQSYQQSTFQHQRHLIAAHQRLNHPCLIQVLRVVDSKRSHRLDLFYEWVPLQFSTNFKMLAPNEVSESREALLNVTEYLVERGFLPTFEPQLVGLSSRRTVKLLLPLTCSEVDRSISKTETLRRKREEIDGFLTMLIKQQRDDQPYYDQQPLGKSKSGTSLGQQQSEKGNANNKQGQNNNAQRNSHNAADGKKAGQGMAVPSPTKTLQASESLAVVRLSSNSGSGDPLSKLKNIDKRIKELEGNRKSYAADGSNQGKNLQQAREIKRSQLPSPQQQQLQQQQSQIQQQSTQQSQQQQATRVDKPVMEKPQSPPQAPFVQAHPAKKRKHFDEESQDTYQQELGETVEMPKITTGSGGLRSTTLAPPKLYAERKEKLSESLGFQQGIKLPLPVIIAGSVHSENDSMSIPNKPSKSIDMQKKVIKRADTQTYQQVKTPKSQTGSNKSPRNKNPPEQSPPPNQQIERRTGQEQRRQQPQQAQQQVMPQYASQHSIPHANFNVNVNVAVNLGDLSKKVDAAYGRVRAVSQNNEAILKSAGLQAKQPVQQQQPQAQVTVGRPEQKRPTSRPQPTIKVEPPSSTDQTRSSTALAQVGSPMSDSKRPQQSQQQLFQVPQPSSPQYKKNPSDKSPREHNQHPDQQKLNAGLVISMEAHYNKNRKSSDTVPKILLLSPARLEHKRPSQEQTQKMQRPALQPQKGLLAPPVAPEQRKDSRTEIEEDFRELHKKKLQKQEACSFEQEKSRQYLYRYQSLFPESMAGDRDDLSVRDPQALQNHLDELYNQSLKFEKNDALVSAFNNLFDTESTRKMTLQTKSLDLSPKSIDITSNEVGNSMGGLNQLERKQEITERVRVALKKSQATLQYFSKMKRSIGAGQPL